MTDDELVCEYLFAVQQQMQDPNIQSDITQMNQIVSSLLELATFLVDKIKKGRCEFQELKQQQDEEISYLKQDLQACLNNYNEFQQFYEEEKGKQVILVDKLNKLEEELKNYKYQNLLLQQQVQLNDIQAQKIPYCETHERVIEDLSQEVHKLEKEFSAMKKKLIEIKHEKNQLELNYQQAMVLINNSEEDNRKLKIERENHKTELKSLKQEMLSIMQNPELNKVQAISTQNSETKVIDSQKNNIYASPINLQAKFSHVKNALSCSSNYSKTQVHNHVAQFTVLNEEIKETADFQLTPNMFYPEEDQLKQSVSQQEDRISFFQNLRTSVLSEKFNPYYVKLLINSIISSIELFCTDFLICQTQFRLFVQYYRCIFKILIIQD